MELAEHVYRGAYYDSAPRMLVLRARAAGVPIESSKLGYRLGRNHDLLCPLCGSLRVRYADDLVCYGCVGTEFVDLEVGRAAYDPDTNQGRRWTQDELEFIRANRNSMSNTALAQALNRTESGVRGQATAMQLGRKVYFKA